MAKVLRGGDEFGNRFAGFGGMAGQHVAKGMGAVVGQVQRSKGQAHDFADRFGRFPMLALNTCSRKASVSLRRNGGCGKQRIVGAIERDCIQICHPIGKGGFSLKKVFGKKRINHFAKLGGHFAGVLGDGFFL